MYMSPRMPSSQLYPPCRYPMFPWEQNPKACLGLKECSNFNSLHRLSIYLSGFCFGKLTLSFILLKLALNLLLFIQTIGMSRVSIQRIIFVVMMRQIYIFYFKLLDCVALYELYVIIFQLRNVFRLQDRIVRARELLSKWILWPSDSDAGGHRQWHCPIQSHRHHWGTEIKPIICPKCQRNDGERKWAAQAQRVAYD